MSGPDDKFLLKIVVLVVGGGIALFVAWLIDRNKAQKAKIKSSDQKDGKDVPKDH